MSQKRMWWSRAGAFWEGPKKKKKAATHVPLASTPAKVDGRLPTHRHSGRPRRLWPEHHPQGLLHRSTLAFMSGFSCVSRCGGFNAAQHELSNVLHWNNLGLSDLQPSDMTSPQSWQTTCSGAVAARMSSTLLRTWSSSSELAIASAETQCGLRRRQ